jgi:hypothetical protein
VTVILEGSIAALLQRIVPCFQRERVPYVLIGAWALAAWGRPRATNDLDFLVLVNEKDVNRLRSRMIQAGLEFDETWQEWNPMLRGLQLRFQFQGITIDVLRPRDPHDQQVFLRRRKKRMDGHYYWVVSTEDFILQKLKVGRPRDFEDAVSVVDRFQGKLDREYLKHWARQLGVTEEFNYIMTSKG